MCYVAKAASGKRQWLPYRDSVTFPDTYGYEFWFVPGTPKQVEK